ncbi:MAG TPA: lysophospholipid acyltransferase family protein [Thermoanaerobaculia bacterium]|jgi:1-acyl-sn-glycerol-3-phosphate acyltransferase|nr:lysophospholipid acyltransferase family protein [Thermoanaerobaculia bacterium]
MAITECSVDPGAPSVNDQTAAERDPLKRYKSYPPEHFSRRRSYLYLFIQRFICSPILIVTRRPKIFGRHNVPKTGPFIVVSNHIDAFDPVLVAHVVDYPIAFMAKKELFQTLIFGEMFRMLGIFALDRGHPSSSTLKTALNVLKSEAKWALGLFPEGTRSRTGKLLPFKKGVGGLAVRSGLPVLPIGIHRNAKGRFIVTVGEPFAGGSDPEAVHAKVHESLVHLSDPGWDRTATADGRK